MSGEGELHHRSDEPVSPDEVPEPTTPSTDLPAPGEDDAPNAPVDPSESPEVVSDDPDVPPGGLPD
jgi:hypothetical protein